MGLPSNIAMTTNAPLPASTVKARLYPHVLFREVLGPDTVAGLLDYVRAREQTLKPALVRNRKSGLKRVDYGIRSSLAIADLGPFKAPFEAFVREIGTRAAAQMNLSEPALEPREFEITAYRDGTRFTAHIDTNERLNQVRVLSCVYYFARTPRPFTGGELRLYALPMMSAVKITSLPSIDIVPETDTMAVFPSWLRHEVLPVNVPSGAWMDSRFTINCWLHRAA